MPTKSKPSVPALPQAYDKADWLLMAATRQAVAGVLSSMYSAEVQIRLCALNRSLRWRCVSTHPIGCSLEGNTLDDYFWSGVDVERSWDDNTVSAWVR